MRRVLVACLALAALAGWGCGGGGDGEDSMVGGVEIEGDSSADLKIGLLLTGRSRSRGTVLARCPARAG